MSIASDISDLKDLSDGVVANKVSRFAYTEQAYTDNDVDGVTVYDVNNDQNIPVGTASVMKVNQTVIEKGWRARASSITRMLMNHFLGRISYNLNKVNDWFNDLLVSISSYLGQPDGIATLDENALVPPAQLPKSDVAENTNTKMFTAKGAFDYFSGYTNASVWLGKALGFLYQRHWAIVDSVNQSVVNLIYAGGIFVAKIANILKWSTDGKVWTDCTGISNYTTMGIKSNSDGTFWVASTQEGIMLWSENGKEWTVGQTLSTQSLLHPCYGNGVWLVHDDYNIYRSTDGKNWVQVSTVTSTQFVNNITYGESNVFIASGYPQGALGTYYAYISTDGGQTWTRTSIQSTRACFCNGIWYLAGYYSTNNGATWQENPSGSPTIVSVAYTEGIWVSVGLSSSIASVYASIDGITWTQVRAGTVNNSYSSIMYANGLWLSSGAGGMIWSIDGYRWSKVTEINESMGMFAISDEIILCTGNNKLWYTDPSMIALIPSTIS